MNSLGAFSVSLNVKDIHASKTFYDALGFVESGGNIEHNYIIMRNLNNVVIGLFHGMFESNVLTFFNPGWDEQCQPLDSYQDVRDIQKELQEKNISIDLLVPPDNVKGPAHITLNDPDGNVILIDQHV